MKLTKDKLIGIVSKVILVAFTLVFIYFVWFYVTEFDVLIKS